MAVESGVVETTQNRRRFFLIGPPTVLLGFANILTATVITDLIVYRTCLVSLNINSTDCLMLRNNSSSPEAVDLETKVEPYASIIVMAYFLIQSILPAVVSLFLGPWSDRNGRKPLLLLSTSGFALMYVILSLMCNLDINPWYLLLASIPAGLGGGIYTAKLAFVCLISDTTAEKDRIVQMTLLEASIYGGTVLTGIAGPSIYSSFGYTHIFTTAAVCCTSSFVYSYFLIPETVKKTSKKSVGELFKISSVKELLASCWVKREGFHRLVVWLSILTIVLTTLINRGEASINFLFTRARLGWDVQHYFYFDGANALLHITGLYGISLHSRFSGSSDILLACISSISTLGSALTKTLAWKSWHMYFSACIGIFTGITAPVMRSVISEFVPAQDAGKIFSLTGLSEILITFGGSALYTLIYSNYLPPTYPSPVFLFSASISVASLLGATWIGLLIRDRRKPPLYIPTAQDELPQYEL